MEGHRQREALVVLGERLGNALGSQEVLGVAGPRWMPAERPGPDSPSGPPQGTPSAKPLI